VQNFVSYEQVSLVNSRQLRDYMVLLLEADDHVSQVTSKPVGGKSLLLHMYI